MCSSSRAACGALDQPRRRASGGARPSAVDGLHRRAPSHAPVGRCRRLDRGAAERALVGAPPMSRETTRPRCAARTSERGDARSDQLANALALLAALATLVAALWWTACAPLL
ncbi:MAG TPA: hypothetical protein VFE37_22415 [Chloroflexota bacterium]|nr:hypothetical protein [Chloroflexota bacterium]